MFKSPRLEYRATPSGFVSGKTKKYDLKWFSTFNDCDSWLLSSQTFDEPMCKKTRNWVFTQPGKFDHSYEKGTPSL